ncbi:MAG: hypothetical protein AAF431_10085 [Pseudomonadota bacterium]
MSEYHIDEAQYKRIDAIRTQSADELFALPNVTGLAVDKRMVRGQTTEELALVVFVSKKCDVESERAVPRNIAGIRTDVQVGLLNPPEESDADFEEDRAAIDRRRYDPIKGGCSVGAVWSGTSTSRATAGTLGVVVNDRSNGALVLLSNEHVLRPVFNSDDPVYQPAFGDDTNHQNKIGKQVRALRTRLIDAAIAGIDPSIDRTIRKSEVIGIGKIRGTAGIALGGAVMKRGRSTGLTQGFVIDKNFFCITPLGHRFDGQLLVQEKNHGIFSHPGDSGALLVALPHHPHAVGLHHAGLHKQGGEIQGVASPIAEVTRRMNIKF